MYMMHVCFVNIYSEIIIISTKKNSTNHKGAITSALMDSSSKSIKSIDAEVMDSLAISMDNFTMIVFIVY